MWTHRLIKPVKTVRVHESLVRAGESIHVPTHTHRHRSLNQRLPETETQPDLLVICILYRPRAHRLEIKDAILFGRGSAYKARGENRLADIGIGAEDLMHAEILE